MNLDRKKWGRHVMEHQPELAVLLKEMGKLFDARVMKMESSCADCCWGEMDQFTADTAVIASDLTALKPAKKNAR
jgi:hypothetical protein